MRARACKTAAALRENAAILAASGLGVMIVAWLSLGDYAWTDYDSEARPAFDALVHGHAGMFLKLAPAYAGSLLLRAPFVLAVKLWGGGELSMFRAAAAPCLAASAVLGVWLVSRMRSRGASRGAQGLVLVLCAANPLALPALQYGHPEELLGAVLCVGSVIAARRDRPMWAGVLLGLAVANKEWAILALGPVLISLPRHRFRALAVAGLAGGAVMAPFMLAGGAVSKAKAATITSGIFNPWQLWWFLGSHAHVVRDLSGRVKVGYRVAPVWVDLHSHELIVAVMVPATLLYLVSRRWSRPQVHDGLLLLTLLLLVRCALDPWDMAYYPLAFLLALTAWEALRFHRLPVLSLGATLAAWVAIQGVAKPQLHLPADAQAAIFLILVVPGLMALAAALYAPGLVSRLSSARGRREPVPAPA